LGRGAPCLNVKGTDYNSSYLLTYLLTMRASPAVEQDFKLQSPLQQSCRIVYLHSTNVCVKQAHIKSKANYLTN